MDLATNVNISINSFSVWIIRLFFRANQSVYLFSLTPQHKHTLLQSLGHVGLPQKNSLSHESDPWFLSFYPGIGCFPYLLSSVLLHMISGLQTFLLPIGFRTMACRLMSVLGRVNLTKFKLIFSSWGFHHGLLSTPSPEYFIRNPFWPINLLRIILLKQFP